MWRSTWWPAMAWKSANPKSQHNSMLTISWIKLILSATTLAPWLILASLWISWARLKSNSKPCLNRSYAEVWERLILSIGDNTLRSYGIQNSVRLYAPETANGSNIIDAVFYMKQLQYPSTSFWELTLSEVEGKLTLHKSESIKFMQLSFKWLLGDEQLLFKLQNFYDALLPLLSQQKPNNLENCVKSHSKWVISRSTLWNPHG